jgi:hypothetical protein
MQALKAHKESKDRSVLQALKGRLVIQALKGRKESRESREILGRKVLRV